MPKPGQKVNLGLKNLAMLPSYFDYIFVHIRQKARLRPELSPKLVSTLGPTYNSDGNMIIIQLIYSLTSTTYYPKFPL